MSIFDYIQKEKAKFQAKREAIQTARHEDKQEALMELRKQRKKAEARAKTDGELRQEKGRIRELKQEKLKSSLGGKVFANMKNKIKESKAKGNVFTGTKELNPIFHSTNKKESESPFTQSNKPTHNIFTGEPEKKEKKKDTIVKIIIPK